MLWYSNRNPTAYSVLLFHGPNADQKCTIEDETWKILRFNVSAAMSRQIISKKVKINPVWFIHMAPWIFRRWSEWDGPDVSEILTFVINPRLIDYSNAHLIKKNNFNKLCTTQSYAASLISMTSSFPSFYDPEFMWYQSIMEI